MRLYLVRHGHSLSAKEAGVPSDFERPLSQQGRIDAREAGLYLKQNESLIHVILHSPLKRACETASEIDTALHCPLGTRVFEPLANVITALELSREIQPFIEKNDSIVLVGHQPQLGDLASLFCGKIIDLKPAEIIAIDLSGKLQNPFLWSRAPQLHAHQ